MKPDLKNIERKKVVSATVIGVLFAAGPFLFWRIFLQQLPLTGPGEATISERFDVTEEEKPTPVPEGQAKLRELLAYPSNSLMLDTATGMLRMYEQGTGRAFEVNPGTLKAFTLSETHLDDFDHTLWSPNGTEVLTLFREEEGSQYRYFDYRSSRVAQLPGNVRILSFSPDGSRIVSARQSDTNTQLWISAPDGTNDWLLMATRLEIVDLDWIADNTIALTSRRADQTSDLLLLDLNVNLRSILKEYEELDVLWARGGRYALISYRDHGQKLALGVLDTEQEKVIPLQLVTRASKCAWHRQSSIICGVSESSSSQSRDAVVTLDLLSGERVVRYQAPDDIWIGVQNPLVLLQGNGLAFINLFDKRPYLISW